MASDLEKRVMDLIGENTDSPDVFDDEGIAEIRSHLGDAIEEISIIGGGYKRVVHVPLKASCFFYQMPEGFGWFDSVYLLSVQRPLEQTSFIGLQEIDSQWLSASGNPTHYVPIGYRKFCVYPAPSSSVDSLEITCVAIPAPYVLEGDRVRLRPAHEWACVNRAVSEFWATRGDAQSAARYFQTYAQESGLPAMYPEQYERRWQFKAKER